MFPTISIKSLHLEYQLWVRELTFYKEEIKIYEDHLEDIVTKNEDIEIKIQVEHFQNQFIRQKEVIDILKHDLNVSEKQLAQLASKLSGSGIDSMKLDNHGRLREKMATFRKIYRELKQEFRRFETECHYC